jgi:TetR/AcrR family fatty acid metabolism transcriptional regulator
VRAQEKLDKRKRILDAAVKVFAAKGFFNAKVAEIARLASVADGTIYLYFKNKDDLLISLFEEVMRTVIVKFRAALTAEAHAGARLARLVRLHLAEFEQNPDLAAVFQVELRQSGRFMREYAKVDLISYLDLIGEIIEEGQRDGFFRRDFPAGVARHVLFGALDEVVSTWVLGGRQSPLENLAEPLVDLFVRGLGRA